MAAGRNPWRQYFSPLLSFPPAPLAYVNQLKVLLAREAYDMVLTNSRMNRQLDKHIIKEPWRGEREISQWKN